MIVYAGLWCFLAALAGIDGLAGWLVKLDIAGQTGLASKISFNDTLFKPTKPSKLV